MSFKVHASTDGTDKNGKFFRGVEADEADGLSGDMQAIAKKHDMLYVEFPGDGCALINPKLCAYVAVYPEKDTP